MCPATKVFQCQTHMIYTYIYIVNYIIYIYIGVFEKKNRNLADIPSNNHRSNKVKFQMNMIDQLILVPYFQQRLKTSAQNW